MTAVCPAPRRRRAHLVEIIPVVHLGHQCSGLAGLEGGAAINRDRAERTLPSIVGPGTADPLDAVGYDDPLVLTAGVEGHGATPPDDPGPPLATPGADATRAYAK